MKRSLAAVSVLVLATSLTAACGSSNKTGSPGASPSMSMSQQMSTDPSMSMPATSAPAPSASVIGNGPAIGDVYAHDGAGMFTAATRGVPYRIYVPNHGDGTVSVIDPIAKKVIDTFVTAPGSQHVIPAWDLKTLYSANDEGGNSLTPIDPITGKREGPNIPVSDPYNMYFTPDGKFAIVVAEAEKRLDFSDPHTFALKHALDVPGCAGVNHIDFSADGSYFIATCEFGGALVKVDTAQQKVLGYLTIGGMPQDIKIDPAGKVWYVSDMDQNGVHEIDGDTFKQIGFIPTGPEAHGLYPSRNAHVLYVSNRGGTRDQGSVSVIDFATRKVIANWPIPAPSTPDMGGVSPDGKTLWLSGRRNNEIYGIDTTTGKLVARIPVGTEPHGLAVWPQPGRYSLGHTGILR
ncbi:MAG TPA: YncE family protein [Frankiaceae bacterium]|jgi:YVTN family beta-propeller protein|nr:YncE family protein [Frankiaceae bacterium]